MEGVLAYAHGSKPGGRGARVLGSRGRLPEAQAAWANAVQLRALEFDDCTDVMPLHPSAAIFPVLLATADVLPLSGQDFVHALALGQDLYVRFALSLGKGPLLSGRGDLYRVFAATAAAARARRLDEAQTLHALGLSASFGSLDRQCIVEDTLATSIQTGNSAAGALSSCELATLGVTGPQEFLLGRCGYLRSVEPEHSVDALLDGLGERLDGRLIAAKPYACCRAAHGAIDLAKQFKAAWPGLQPEEIERVEIVVTPEVNTLVGGPREVRLRPPTTTAAQFSMHFIVATALLHGDMGLADSRPSSLQDPRTLALAERVHVRPDPANRTDTIIGATDLTLHLAGRAPLAGRSASPLGGPFNPMSLRRLRDKLIACLDHAHLQVPGWKIDRFLEQVEDIEGAPVARTLFDAFTDEVVDLTS